MNDLRALAEAMGCPDDGFWKAASLRGGLVARAQMPAWRPPLAVQVRRDGVTVLVGLKGLSRRGLQLSVTGRTLALFGVPLRGSPRGRASRPLGGYRTVGRFVRLPVRALPKGARAVLTGATLTVELRRPRGRGGRSWSRR